MYESRGNHESTVACAFTRRPRSDTESRTFYRCAWRGSSFSVAHHGALCDPQVDEDEVKGWLKGEPSLCARVLKVANSPLYGQVRAVASLDRALRVLGLDTLRGIAAAACLDRAMEGGKSTLLDLNSVVSHSQATAAAAESLARYCFPELTSEAFIAGLLHNLGTVVQVHIDPVGVGALLAARRAGDDRSLAVLEAQFIAIGHEECGAVIFEEWCLPQALVAATRHHHSPLCATAAERRLTGLINISSALALASGAGLALEPAVAAAHPDALECLGLDEGQLAEAAVAVAGRITELKNVLA